MMEFKKGFSFKGSPNPYPSVDSQLPAMHMEKLTNHSKLKTYLLRMLPCKQQTNFSRERFLF